MNILQRFIPSVESVSETGIDRLSKDNMATVTAERGFFSRAFAGGLFESNHSNTRTTRVGVSIEEGRKEERKNESPLT